METHQIPGRLENESEELYVERIKGTFKTWASPRVLDPGHKYALPHFENQNEFSVIFFIKKEPKLPGSTELVTVQDGLTNEAVLEMLIDRCESLFNKFPSPETGQAIVYMKQALEQLELRTLRRIARNVEGKHLS